MVISTLVRRVLVSHELPFSPYVPPLLIQCHLLRMGDGKTFPRNHRSDEMLARLANELVKAEADN